MVTATSASLLLALKMTPGCAWKRRVLRDGARARATVLSAERYGGYTNGVPKYRLQVLVRPDDRDAFPATVSVRDFVNPSTVVGEEAIVRFDPESTDRVVFESFPEVERRHRALMNTAMVRRLQRQQALERELDASPTSVRTAARVTAFERANMEMGGGLVATVVIEVAVPGGDRFTAGILGLFAPSGLHKYQPGRDVFVVYDPSDRTSRIGFDPRRTTTNQTSVETVVPPTP